MKSRAEQTPEEREMYAERRRQRDREKRRRARAAERAARIGAVTIIGSKTSPENRRKLCGIIPEMSKSELRAMLAQAVRNTAEARQ